MMLTSHSIRILFWLRIWLRIIEWTSKGRRRKRDRRGRMDEWRWSEQRRSGQKKRRSLQRWLLVQIFHQCIVDRITERPLMLRLSILSQLHHNPFHNSTLSINRSFFRRNPNFSQKAIHCNKGGNNLYFFIQSSFYYLILECHNLISLRQTL